MDEEKATMRRSSILKTIKIRSEDDEHTGETGTQRRVSFASKSAVKPFTHDAEANTIWDPSYEEIAIHSDQSISHIADTGPRTSTDVSTVHQTQRLETMCVKYDSVPHITCGYIDANPQYKNEGMIGFYQATTHPKPKFGIYIEDESTLETLNCPPDKITLFNPSLLKENMNTNFNLKGHGREENMQIEKQTMEFTRRLPTLHKGHTKKEVVNCREDPMDMENIVDKENVNNIEVGLTSAEIDMNFTIHPVKNITSKNAKTKMVQHEDSEDDMEFTSAIPVHHLEEKFRNRHDFDSDRFVNDVMELTFNSYGSKVIGLASDSMRLATATPANKGDSFASDRMEFTTPIPEANMVDEVEDGYMEFTKSISPKRLEKLWVEDGALKTCDKDNRFDVACKSKLIKDNICWNNGTECDMELEKDISDEKTATIPQVVIHLAAEIVHEEQNIICCNDGNKTVSKECLMDLDECAGKKERTKISKILTHQRTISKQNLHCNNNQISSNDINILINKKEIEIREIGILTNLVEEYDIGHAKHIPKNRDSSFCQSNGSCHTNPAYEVDDTQYLIYCKSLISEGSPLKGSNANTNNEKFQIYDDENLLQNQQAEPNKVTILSEFAFSTSQNRNNLPVNTINSPGKIQNEFNEELSSSMSRINQMSQTCNDSITEQHVKTNLNKFVSDVNVFNPSSKRNISNGFCEPMELGTPYMTIVNDSNDKLNASNICAKESSQMKVATYEPDEINRGFEKLLKLDESTIRTVRALQYSKSFILPEVKCHETDKIIFTTESAKSLQLEEAPDATFGILRSSIYGVTEAITIITPTPSPEILSITINEETLPIPDDSFDAIQFNSEDGELENVSKSKVVFYDYLNDELEDNSSAEEDAVKPKTCRTVPPLSSLSCMPVNCSLDQLYGLLGLSTEEMPKYQSTPRLTPEDVEKRRIDLQVKAKAEENAFDQLVQSCSKIMETIIKVKKEDDLEAEEKLSRNQGKSLVDLSVECVLWQQQKIPSTLWTIHSLTSRKCIVSSRNDFVYFHLEMAAKPYIITNIRIENVAEGRSLYKASQFIGKLIVDKTQETQIRSAIGVMYNLRTFMEFLQIKLEDVVKVEREFLKIFGTYRAEARLQFDDNLNLLYTLVGRSRWLIKIDCSDLNKLSEHSIMEISTLNGNTEVPKREIEKLAKKCPKGLHFLYAFVVAVFEFRNVRERQYCRVLNELLSEMGIK